ncbi:MAG: pyridoxal-phosphate dependent enzyme [Acidobacteriaceae bacterium]
MHDLHNNSVLAQTSGARVTLGEGNTPLVESISQRQPSHGQLLFKMESCNPTGSYKDRFVATEVDRILRLGARSCMATSSGNTGSSLAAYCARYGLQCIVMVNQDAPAGKLAQMQAHGAQVIRIPGFVTDAAITSDVFSTLQKMSVEQSIPFVVSAFHYCPEGMRGVEEISTELLQTAPDHVFVPVGGAGLYSAIVQGFLRAGSKLPRVHAVQPEGCLTLVASYLAGTSEIRSVHSTTRISGLSVPSNIDASRALRLLHECNGTGIAVSDETVFAAQHILMTQEGIYCEPAGATAFAGWKQATEKGLIGEGETSVCLVTGHGFKDPASVEQLAMKNPTISVSPNDLAAHIMERIG